MRPCSKSGILIGIGFKDVNWLRINVAGTIHVIGCTFVGLCIYF